MLVRIVKMSFHEENIPAFLENFELMKSHIRNTPGNRFLELYQDKNNPCIFLHIVIGKQKTIWKTIENRRYLMKFGRLPRNYLMTNPKLGV